MSHVQTVAEIKDKLTPVFAVYGAQSAILFGSIAKGAATENEDTKLVEACVFNLSQMGDFARPLTASMPGSIPRSHGTRCMV